MQSKQFTKDEILFLKSKVYHTPSADSNVSWRRFSGLVVVPRELLLHWNGNMRKSAKIIAGRLKNYHLYYYQRSGRSRCFRVDEAMTRLRRTWTMKRACFSAVIRAQETGFALLDIGAKNEPQRWVTAFSCENLSHRWFPTTSDFCLL